jgi:hypothetical protein
VASALPDSRVRSTGTCASRRRRTSKVEIKEGTLVGYWDGRGRWRGPGGGRKRRTMEPAGAGRGGAARGSCEGELPLLVIRISTDRLGPELGSNATQTR